MKKILFLFFALSSSLQASDIIPSVYSTGVNDFYNPLNDNSIDFHYSVKSPTGEQNFTYAVDPQIVSNPNNFGPRSMWLDPSSLNPTAKWISFSTNPSSVDSRMTYDYETLFNIDRFQIDSVLISGKMSSSSSGSVYLNGNYLFSHYSTPDSETYRSLKSFNISNSTGFLLPGINRLTFEISNGSPSMGFSPPSGLLVSMSGYGNVVPEPSSYILCGIGVIALIFAMKK